MDNNPITLFLLSKFTQKELVSSKKQEALQLAKILSSQYVNTQELTPQELQYLMEYKEFTKNPIQESFQDYPIQESFQDHVKELEVNYTKVLYIPSDTFKGKKNGWYFGTGDLGLGYYFDVKKHNVKFEKNLN